MDTQRDTLRARFAERLFEMPPTSLLDIGAGDGDLVRQAGSKGILAVGLELERGPGMQSGRNVAFVRATASDLPFADGSFDRVSLRHVPHHLPDLSRSLSEAWRVARGGLWIAEPWFDETVPDQRFALRADRWLKRQDRRQGRFHADVLSADELLAAIPGRHEGHVETFRPERPWTAEDFEEEARKASGGMGLDDEDQRELDNLITVARRGRMTLNGTLILTVEKG